MASAFLISPEMQDLYQISAKEESLEFLFFLSKYALHRLALYLTDTDSTLE